MTDINEIVDKATPEQLRLAIQDVLEIPNWSNYMDETETEIRETTAYNRALEDVYQAITNRLGGME